MKKRKLLCYSLCLYTAFMQAPLFSVSAAWNFNGSGDWSKNTNWTPTVFPNGINDVATFPNLGGTTRTVTVDGNFTVGTLDFTSTDDYTIAAIGGNFLTLQAGVSATINTVSGGANMISTSMALSSPVVHNIAPIGSITISGAMSGPGGYVKAGAGLVTLSGINTYVGGTTIAGGTLSLLGSGSLLSTGTVNLSTGGSVFNISSITTSTTIGDLSGVASSTVNLGSKTLIFGTATLSTPFAGNIVGGSGSVVKQGSGTVILTGLNTYSGGTTINAGTLSLSGSGSLLSTGAVSVSSATSVFDISGTTSGTMIGDLSGASSSTVNLGSKTLTFGTATPSTPFAGNIIGGGGSIIKQGSGTVILTGTNTYSGGTTINAGTLRLSGSGSLFSTGAVNVNSATSVFDISGTTSGTMIGDLSGVASSSVNLGSKALTFGTATPSTPFAGNINGGGGSIIKQGSGTAILTGTNSYSGGTTISAGTLQGNTVSLQGNILDNANLVFDQGGAGTYSGSITGTGTLVTQGAGPLNFIGASTLANQVTVSSGTLLINGSLAGGGPMIVSSGATLGGTGTITKNITIQGTLSPGNSIGTINLVGAQVLTSGSMLDIEITPTTNDLVNVTGTMDIQSGATLRFIPDTGDYSSPFTHTLIHTTAGVTGTFTNVISTLPLFSGNVTYTATDVLLSLGMLPFSTLVSTGNAGKVAHCLDGFTPAAGSDMEVVINELHFVTNAEELEKALLHMQPAQFTALALMQENNTLDVNSGLFNHIESLQPYCSPKKRGINLWFLPFGTRQTQSHHHQNPGYRATTPGVLLGMDGFATDRFLLGGFLGYSHSNLKWSEKFGSAHQDTGYASLYSKWGKRHAYLESSLIFGYSRYETNRHIFFAFDGELDRHAKGQHHGLQGSFHVKAAGDFERRKIIMSPFAQASYIYLHEGSFKEHGAQSLNLHVASKNSDLLTSEAGLKLSHCFSASRTTVTPYIQGSALYEARYRGLHEKAGFNGCRLDVRGLNPSRVLGSVEAGIHSTLANQACGLSLFYQGRFGKRFADNALYAQLNVNF